MNLRKYFITIASVTLISCVSEQSVVSENKFEIEITPTAEEGEFLPIYAVAPRYPMRAIYRGVTGSCTIEYTVTKKGTTKDHKVKSCSNEIFEDPSLLAARKFKYEPRIENGKPVDVTNVTNKFRFQIEKQ